MLRTVIPDAALTLNHACPCPQSSTLRPRLASLPPFRASTPTLASVVCGPALALESVSPACLSAQRTSLISHTSTHSHDRYPDCSAVGNLRLVQGLQWASDYGSSFTRRETRCRSYRLQAALDLATRHTRSVRYQIMQGLSVRVFVAVCPVLLC